MPTVQMIVHKPAGAAMTLNELEAFVQDAKRSGATGSEVPQIVMYDGFRTGAKRAEVEIAGRTTAPAAACAKGAEG